MTLEISNLEMEALQALMELGEATVAALHQHMAPKKMWAYSTVGVFLRRLEIKGLVEHGQAKGKRAFIYRPTRRP
jgi:predicted transcriptional regulator